MSVSVSRDLTVQVVNDLNADKLTDRQLALHSSVQKGEPKSLGISQMMLGFMLILYAIPLLFTEITEVVQMGVPWWSGLVFITTGVIAIRLERYYSVKTLRLCFMASVASIVLSVVAVIIYAVDLWKSLVVPCEKLSHGSCPDRHFATKLSRGLKSSLLLFTLVQTVISSILCFLLNMQRRCSMQYYSLSASPPTSPTSVTPPDIN
ncbi:transmembrane protein 176 [Genypterus blacodes]|uniref:transmembrane protein 176 n=1 Tax=Genypterus blacodes TaxID=154954 RepID=UPI003F767589